MTNQPASGTGPAMSLPPEPVTSYENRQVHGLALCMDGILEDEVAKIQALRARQAAYCDSLPTDPSECITAATKALYSHGENYPRGLEEALHLSCALAPMINAPGYEEPGPERDALLWIAGRIQEYLQDAAGVIDRAADILGNPARIERESRRASRPR